MRVALLGTGRMGAAMVRRLRVADVDLMIYNRTRETAETVAARSGARTASSAREAVLEADMCLVSLADDAAVEATYAGPDGLVAGLRPGTVVCETSTVTPATVRGLAKLVAERGATLLDCPVSGSVPVVERGELTVMAGGDEAALDRVRPVLDIIATRVFHLGDVGAGATMKLVVNSLVHALDVALSEALVLAEKAGLDRERVYDVLEASAVGAPFVHYKRAAFLDPEGTPVAFSLDLVDKDLVLITELASEVAARMEQAGTNRRLVAEAVASGLGQRDMSVLAEYLR
ncbi:MAG TPA: NAD(P)-dependent oxidoreductase [Nocardioidaceae bacterium]|nr:NAD(P)-dependent oxidoreductase [Nocardioidaceae bacterium]